MSIKLSQEILDNNRLICEYVAKKGVGTEEFPEAYINIPVNGMDTITSALEWTQFHRNWNWIMPVVEKLNTSIKTKSGYISPFEGIRIHPDTVYLHFGNFRLTNVVSEGKVEGRFKCLLDALYNAVVEFLNYKKNKDEQH